MKHQSTWLSRLVFSVRRNYYQRNDRSRAKENSCGDTHKQERSEKSVNRYSYHFACDSDAGFCDHLILFR